MNKFFILVSLSFIFSSYGFSQTRYEQVKGNLVSLAGKYPQTTKLITVGDSDAGDKILGLQIGNGPIHNMVVATHHGNEYGSTVVAMYFAESVAMQPIEGQTVFVVPVLNISGYNANNRREIAKGTTWDPNRNYPGPCATEGPFTLKSTTALAKFIDDNNITASATLHTFASKVMYPWGISTHQTSTPYDTTFIQMGQAATVESHYQVGNSTVLLYPADGTYEDFAFWHSGIWSMLFELGTSHSPSTGDLQKMVQENIPGLRRMFMMAPKVRAPDHAFHGQCQVADARPYDRHDE